MSSVSNDLDHLNSITDDTKTQFDSLEDKRKPYKKVPSLLL